MKHVICDIYRSPKKEGMYLYINKAKGLSVLPEALVDVFGKPSFSMTMLLKPEKPLANADITKVLQALDDKGYYLQMPPAVDDYMREIHLLNSKLPI